MRPETQPPIDQLPAARRMRVRFGATLIANLIRAGVSFLGGLIVAHGLGASGYGDLNFLLGSFAAISQLFEMGTSSAFYTFISKRPRQVVFFVVYFCWLGIQFLTTVLAVGLLLPDEVVGRIWVGNRVSLVLLAFAASFLMVQGWGSVVQLAEAARNTVLIQGIGIAQAFAHLLLVVSALHFGWLTVHSVLFLFMGEHLLLVSIFGPRMLSGNIVRGEHTRPASIVKDFVTYCRPLAVYAWVGFLYAFADRWLLQHFSGSEQQGFFAVGQQFANVSLIGAASMLKVFWKEVAEARQRQDVERVRRLYASVSRGLFIWSAWTSCLLIPYSRDILAWTVGPGYEAASVTLGIMFLYPIHQSLGQIQGTYFYATGETAAYVRIGLIAMGVSIPLTYLLLAPSGLGGLALGSVGVALKMVVLQFVGVTLQAVVIARKYGIATDCVYQMAVLAALMSLAWISRWMAGAAFAGAELPLVSGWIAGLGVLLYLSGSIVLVWRMPWVIGSSREQISRALGYVSRTLRSAA